MTHGPRPAEPGGASTKGEVRPMTHQQIQERLQREVAGITVGMANRVARRHRTYAGALVEARRRISLLDETPELGRGAYRGPDPTAITAMKNVMGRVARCSPS